MSEIKSRVSGERLREREAKRLQDQLKILRDQAHIEIVQPQNDLP